MELKIMDGHNIMGWKYLEEKKMLCQQTAFHDLNKSVPLWKYIYCIPMAYIMNTEHAFQETKQTEIEPMELIQNIGCHDH